MLSAATLRARHCNDYILFCICCELLGKRTLSSAVSLPGGVVNDDVHAAERIVQSPITARQKDHDHQPYLLLRSGRPLSRPERWDVAYRQITLTTHLSLLSLI